LSTFAFISMLSSLPLISCICVTRGRPYLLNGAISCFAAQTYPNKELVIVYEKDDEQTCRYINSLQTLLYIRCICIEPSPEKKLGYLRNYAIEQSHGVYICQWDDDDWYHCQRLEEQYNTLHTAGLTACVLNRWLMFDHTNQKAYISMKRMWEGSLLCRKDVLQNIHYDNKSMGEDSIVIMKLHRQKQVHIINTPHLYIYNYHGANTWHYAHWNGFFNISILLDESTSHNIHAILQHQYNITEASALLDDIMDFNKHLI